MYFESVDIVYEVFICSRAFQVVQDSQQTRPSYNVVPHTLWVFVLSTKLCCSIIILDKTRLGQEPNGSGREGKVDVRINRTS